MILGEPSLRPTTSAVLKHPLFWSKEKALTYLQDVSDRVDRETTDSYILASIERNRMEIVKGNFSHIILKIWYFVICKSLSEALIFASINPKYFS